MIGRTGLFTDNRLLCPHPGLAPKVFSGLTRTDDHVAISQGKGSFSHLRPSRSRGMYTLGNHSGTNGRVPQAWCFWLVSTFAALSDILITPDPLSPFSLDHSLVCARFEDIKARAKVRPNVEDSGRPRCLQSADFQADYLQSLSTPPDTPPANLDLNNASLASTTGTVRRRIPWTLSESLKLWHGAYSVDRPSWARIWQKYFRSSRRTPVDLKDRWRVICRNSELQEQLRRVYEGWRTSGRATSVDSGPN
ncbi:unnamed protein product [Schistocephalus solidus]|uniref:Myb-like domain-containing protein n=1 Tax=Schistocephalus solidus TaxID=70667 RepID=A0A183S7B9_SCHSO|nr:unnamed protein product [Schistocephalus solidus]